MRHGRFGWCVEKRQRSSDSNSSRCAYNLRRGLELNSDLNYIRVRSFILSGAPDFHHPEQNCEQLRDVQRRLLARLRHADRLKECPLGKVDRKRLAHGQKVENDPGCVKTLFRCYDSSRDSTGEWRAGQPKEPRSGPGDARQSLTHGWRSKSADSFADDGNATRTSAAMSASDQIGAACWSATIRPARLSRTIAAGRSRSGIDGGDLTSLP